MDYWFRRTAVSAEYQSERTQLPNGGGGARGGEALRQTGRGGKLDGAIQTLSPRERRMSLTGVNSEPARLHHQPMASRSHVSFFSSFFFPTRLPHTIPKEFWAGWQAVSFVVWKMGKPVPALSVSPFKTNAYFFRCWWGLGGSYSLCNLWKPTKPKKSAEVTSTITTSTNEDLQSFFSCMAGKRTFSVSIKLQTI